MLARIAPALAGAALAFAVSAFVPSHFSAAPAAADNRVVLGGGDAGLDDEVFKFKTLKGNHMSASFRRAIVKVPAGYGKLVHVSGSGSENTLWFQGDDGRLRNVVCAAADGLYQVEFEK